MNPYVTRILELLGDRDPIEVLKQTPGRLGALTAQIDPEKSYGPGKWTARQILCHLADAELANAFRFRQIVAGVETIQPWNQEVWAGRYAGLSLPLALKTFRAARAWNLAWLEGLDRSEWQKSAHHPERGIQTLETMIRMNAGHDLNHLAQLGQIAAGR